MIRESLPPATEAIVFCRPTEEQVALYEKSVASSTGARALLRGEAGDAFGISLLHGVLPLISALRRLCNHPSLIRRAMIEGGTEEGGKQDDEEIESDAEDVAFLLDDTGRGEARESRGVGMESSGSWRVTDQASTKDTRDVGGSRTWKVPRASRAAGNADETTSKPIQDFETQSSGKLVVLEALLRAVRREYNQDKVRWFFSPREALWG